MPRVIFALIFIAIVSITARLIWIDQPYTDNWSWRQSDVACIARNFYHGGYHIAYPRIDWAGDQPGYVGTEFPILPFAAAICYKALGVHEWIGRVEAVIFFTLSLPFFFLLVREIFDQLSATWALFFYALAPLNVFTGREFMPDVPSLTLSLVGLYYFVRWINSDVAPPLSSNAASSKYFVFSATCISLSILVKLTSLLIGVPLACLALQRFKFAALREVRLWAFAAIALVPSILWYAHACDIALKYYPHHFFGAGGVRLMSLPWYWRIFREMATSSLTIPLLALSIIGVAVARNIARARLFYWWLGAMAVFMIMVGYGNRHQWYQLPLVPIAGVFSGVACSFLAQRFPSRGFRIRFAVVTVVTFCSCSFLAATPLYYSSASIALRNLGLALKAATPPDALVVTADIGDPTVFYYAERKGWHFLEKDGIFQGDPLTGEQARADLEQLRQRGASYLAFTWATIWWLDYYKELAEYIEANAVVIRESPEFRIYKLKPLNQ